MHNTVHDVAHQARHLCFPCCTDTDKSGINPLKRLAGLLLTVHVAVSPAAAFNPHGAPSPLHLGTPRRSSLPAASDEMSLPAADENAQGTALISLHDEDISRVFLIVGDREGTGKVAARSLGAIQGHFVIFCAENETYGTTVAEELQDAGCNVIYRGLNVRNQSSIDETGLFIAQELGRLDEVVVNTAIGDYVYFVGQHNETAEDTVDSYFFGTVRLMDAMMPLLRASLTPRLVVIADKTNIALSATIAKQFHSPDLKVSGVSDLMMQYVHDRETDVWREHGWPRFHYTVCKLGLIAYTRILARNEPDLTVWWEYPRTDTRLHDREREKDFARLLARMGISPEQYEELDLGTMREMTGLPRERTPGLNHCLDKKLEKTAANAEARRELQREWGQDPWLDPRPR